MSGSTAAGVRQSMQRTEGIALPSASVERQRWFALGMATYLQLVSTLGSYVFGPLAPFLIAGFGIDRSTLGLFISTFYGAAIVLGIPAGWICDRFGARRSLAVGFMVCGLFLAAVALQTAVFPVFCLLFVSGCGYTVTSPGTTKLVVDWFPAARRGIPAAIKQCGPMLAVMLLALTAPVLALVAGWPTVIAGVGFLIAGSGVLCWLWCPDEPAGRSSNPTGSWTGSLTLFKQRDVLLLCSVGTVLVIAQTGVSSYLVLYAVEDLHIPLVAAGWCLAAAQVTGLLGRLTVGLISDRYYAGRRKPVIAALCVITAAGLLALGLIPGGASLVTVLAASLLIGLGALSWSAIVILAVAERAGRNQAGLAVGFTVMTFQSAIVVAPPLIGRALDLPGSHNWVWTALGFAMLLALVLTWAIDESSK